MITRGMDIKDIVNEYEKDEKELLAQHLRLNNDNRYRRFILKNLKGEASHVFEPVHYKSTRGNDYIIVLATKGYGQYKKYGLEAHTYLYYRIDNSNYYIVSQTDYYDMSDRYGYTFYTPHFFDRYQERFLEGKSIPRLKLVTEFFKNNYCKGVINLIGEEESKFSGSYYNYVPDGIILGRYSESLTEECERRILFCNTFISFDMLKGSQLGLVDNMKDIFIKANSVTKKDEASYQKIVDLIKQFNEEHGYEISEEV